ncbi:MAG: hypothetical protein WCH99_12850 [Verrucomicrobiota bacterium]
MIRVPIERISRLPAGYAGDLRQASIKEESGFMWFQAAALQTVVDRHEPGRLGGKAISLHTEEVKVLVSGRMAACSGCDWNHEWICEHVGCKPCQQRKLAGGLKTMLERADYRCPAGKF